MNKLIVLYDMLKTMRSKEVVTGSLAAKVEKGQAKVFGLESEFEKNLVTGKTKSKVNVEMDYEGKPAGGEPDKPHYEHCHLAREGHRGFEHHHGFHDRGDLRVRFSRWAFCINLLHSLQLEKKEDKKMVFTLNAQDLSEDVKELFQQRMRHAAFRHPHGVGLMKLFQSSASLDFVMTVLVNEQAEVEKIRVVAVNEEELTATGELSLQW